MFCIERKVVHVGTEKIITLYLYKVSVKFQDFSLMMRKITLEVKFDEKYVHFFLNLAMNSSVSVAH